MPLASLWAYQNNPKAGREQRFQIGNTQQTAHDVSDDSKSDQMNGQLFWECRDSSIWLSQTAELDCKHREEQIPQPRLGVGNGDKYLDENGQCTKGLDGKMASKQNFQNDVTDTMIQVAIDLQGIIMQVRFGIGE